MKGCELDLILWVDQQLAGIPELNLLAPAELSVSAFTVRGDRGAQQNQQTRRLLSLINQQQRVLLTGTLLHGVYAIRIAIVSFRTHKQHVETLVVDLKQALARMKQDGELT